MNIAIFSDVFLPKVDGVTVSTVQFIELLSQNHNFKIFCPRYSGDDITTIHEQKIVRLDSLPLPSYPEIRMALPSLQIIKTELETFKPDLIHFQTPGFVGQFGILAAKHYGIPLLGTYHTLVSKQGAYISPYRLLKLDSLLNLFEIKNPLINILESITRTAEQLIAKPMIFSLCNNLYESADLILSPSHAIKKELEEAGVKIPIRVLSNGIDRSKFISSPRSFPDSPARILHCGRLSYEKNCDTVIDAFEVIKKTLPESTLNVVGDGPALNSLIQSVKEKKLSDSVTFTGMIPRDRLPEIYKTHDLFITASTMETQGMVVLEAITSGLPCVGVNSHALPELIIHGENGFISEEGDYISIAEFAGNILTDRELYEKFSANSIKFSEKHDLNICAGKLENIYRDIAEMKSKYK